MNGSHEYLGSNCDWRRVRATTTGNTTIFTIPAATGGTPVIKQRIVLLGYHITGLNTNAALTTFEIRNSTTTTAVALDGSMAATTGSIQMSNSGVWIPMVAGEDLQLSVGGALTGNLSVTVWFKLFPETTSLSNKYTGIAP